MTVTQPTSTKFMHASKLYVKNSYTEYHVNKTV